MMNYSGPDKKNSGSSFDNQDFGIYGRGYEGYAPLYAGRKRKRQQQR